MLTKQAFNVAKIMSDSIIHEGILVSGSTKTQKFLMATK